MSQKPIGRYGTDKQQAKLNKNVQKGFILTEKRWIAFNKKKIPETNRKEQKQLVHRSENNEKVSFPDISKYYKYSLYIGLNPEKYIWPQFRLK